jgi:hypothetical protein
LAIASRQVRPEGAVHEDDGRADRAGRPPPGCASRRDINRRACRICSGRQILAAKISSVPVVPLSRCAHSLALESVIAASHRMVRRVGGRQNRNLDIFRRIAHGAEPLHGPRQREPRRLNRSRNSPVASDRFLPSP